MIMIIAPPPPSSTGGTTGDRCGRRCGRLRRRHYGHGGGRHCGRGRRYCGCRRRHWGRRYGRSCSRPRCRGHYPRGRPRRDGSASRHRRWCGCRNDHRSDRRPRCRRGHLMVPRRPILTVFFALAAVQVRCCRRGCDAASGSTRSSRARAGCPALSMSQSRRKNPRDSIDTALCGLLKSWGRKGARRGRETEECVWS